MMEILYWVAVASACVSVLFIVVVTVYFYWLQGWLEYRKAKEEICEYLEKYRGRCNGANRFVVNVSALQEIFVEYDTETINKVWTDLVNKHVITKDPQDSEWCIR